MAENEGEPQSEGAPRLDPAQLQYLKQQLESEQSFGLALVVGTLAALVGAAAWAGATVLTGYQIGFMALAIGVLVGFAVRAAGKGITRAFGVLGAALSAASCALGNLLAVTALVAQEQAVPFLAALSQLTPELARDLMVAFFRPMDLLFYGFAIYEGYRLAFRQIGPAEVERMLSGGGTLG